MAQPGGREFFNSLLANSSKVCRFRRCNWRLGLVQRQRRGFKASLGKPPQGIMLRTTKSSAEGAFQPHA